MTPATLLPRPVAPAAAVEETLTCVACFGAIDGPSDTGLYCASCACHRCGEDATASTADGGYCERCADTLRADGFFG